MKLYRPEKYQTIHFTKALGGVEEMAPCKHRDLILIPMTLRKKIVQACWYTFLISVSPLEGETDNSWASLVYWMNSRTMRDPIPKLKGS